MTHAHGFSHLLSEPPAELRVLGTAQRTHSDVGARILSPQTFVTGIFFASGSFSAGTGMRISSTPSS